MMNMYSVSFMNIQTFCSLLYPLCILYHCNLIHCFVFSSLLLLDISSCDQSFSDMSLSYLWLVEIIFLSYQSTLKQLFQEFENGDSNSQLAAVTMRIMQALQTNLDGKSKQYKDPALSHLFLMNNIHYMVRSVRRFVYVPLFGEKVLCYASFTYSLYAYKVFYLLNISRSEAKDLLGDDWVQRHRRIVQQHANQYKRIAWAKVIFLLIRRVDSDLILLQNYFI